MTDPFIQCPTYENQDFLLRLVTVNEAMSACINF